MRVTDGGVDVMEFNIKGEVVLKDLSCRSDINAHELKGAINQ
jgi:galactokinase/mevalonate kinase-like predicted kinase